MVGTAQPVCLSASGTEGRRYDSTMNLRKRKTHSVSLHYWRWTANTLCFAVAGEAFVLTFTFIERHSWNAAPRGQKATGFSSMSRFQFSSSSLRNQFQRLTDLPGSVFLCSSNRARPCIKSMHVLNTNQLESIKNANFTILLLLNFKPTLKISGKQ
jgi:hypothetical protein